MKLVFLMVPIICASSAWARVFNLQKEKLSSYLVAGMSQSNLKATPLTAESSAVSFTEVYSTITSGEFGITYGNGPFGFRFGFEIIKPLALTGQGQDGAASDLYTYQTNINVMNPKIGADINVYTGQQFRLMLFGYYGLASYSNSMSYTNNTLGGGAHTVEHRSSAPCYGGGVAGEVAFFDTTTFIFDVAYRQLKFVNVKYGNSVTTLDGGAKVTGDPVLNDDGSPFQVDFTGVVINAGLRFYL